MVIHTRVIDPTTTNDKSRVLGNCFATAFPALDDFYPILSY
jgi:hypothetical protein